MRLKVKLLPEAFEDIQEALDWYGKINEALKIGFFTRNQPPDGSDF
ncbi:hypothetical protein [Nonlabens spongiae]|nr:hypothetical protein [Nonlabens spongiae]